MYLHSAHCHAFAYVQSSSADYQTLWIGWCKLILKVNASQDADWVTQSPTEQTWEKYTFGSNFVRTVDTPQGVDIDDNQPSPSSSHMQLVQGKLTQPCFLTSWAEFWYPGITKRQKRYIGVKMVVSVSSSYLSPLHYFTIDWHHFSVYCDVASSCLQ